MTHRTSLIWLEFRQYLFINLPCPFMVNDCPSSTRKFLVGTSPFRFFVHFLESQARINLDSYCPELSSTMWASRGTIVGCSNEIFPAIWASPFSVKLHEISLLPFSTNPLKFLEKGRSDFLAPSRLLIDQEFSWSPDYQGKHDFSKTLGEE